MIRQALAKQLGFNLFVIERNLAGVTQEQSLARHPSGGSHMNWVIGHVLATRGFTHALLGSPPPWDDATAAPYQRGSAPPSAADALPTERILADLHASHEALLAALAAIDPARLAEPADVPPDTPLAGCNVGEALAGMIFHECYHAGQIGVLRRVAGLDGALA